MKSIRMLLLITIVVLILVPGLVTHVSAADKVTIPIFLSSSPSPSEYGQTITFRVDFKCPYPPSGSCRVPDPIPTGQVAFYIDEGPETGPLNIVDGGPVFLPTAGLGPGSHSIRAVYLGDSNYNPSSTAMVQVIGYGTITTITSSDNPHYQYPDNPVTFTAHVVLSSNNLPVTAGKVTFYENGYGRDGNPFQIWLGEGIVGPDGIATFTPSILGVGSYRITGRFTGSTGYNDLPSMSDIMNQIVSLTPTNTTTNFGDSPIIDHYPISMIYGAYVTYWNTTTHSNSPLTDGTVTFWENSTQLETDNLDSHGFARFQATLPDGSHNITAVFNGCTGAEPSRSPSVIQVVEPMPTTTTTDLGSSPIIAHDPISTLFSSQVTYWDPFANNDIPVIDGTVTFWENTTQLETDTLDSSGIVRFHTTLPVGSHNITVVFNGGSGWGSSSVKVIQVVEPMPTSTSVLTTHTPVYFGEPVTFTANVTWYDSFTGNIPITDGTVTFNDGTTSLGTVPLNSSGYATLPTSSLAVGSHSVTAVYNGGNGWATSTSGSLTQTVLPAVTITTVASSTTPSIYSQTVRFTSSVAVSAPGAGIPTGTVTFTDGLVVLGTSTLNSSGGTYLDVSSLSAGTHSIKATYNGNTNFAGSWQIVTQTVNKAGTGTMVVSNKTPTVFGEPVRFTASVTVSAPGAGIPTGTVTFKDGSSTIGTGTLSGNSVTFSTSALTLGLHTITASYGGDTNFTGSTSSGIAQQVNPLPVITSFGPATAVHGTTANMAILGNYFQNGMTVKLVQGTTIIPVTVNTLKPPSRIAASVTIPSSARGKWNLVVSNTDGGICTRLNAYTIT